MYVFLVTRGTFVMYSLALSGQYDSWLPPQKRLKSPYARSHMKSPAEVLLMKELELQKVKKEVEALRITARLLGDEKMPRPQVIEKSAKVVQLP
jgi:hypothetical protein